MAIDFLNAKKITEGYEIPVLFKSSEYVFGIDFNLDFDTSAVHITDINQNRIYKRF